MIFNSDDEIWNLIWTVDEHPDGEDKIAVLGDALESAERSHNDELINYCLVDLMVAYVCSPDATRLVDTFRRLQQRWTEQPSSFDSYLTHRYLWGHKWVLNALRDNPDVPWPEVEEAWHDLKEAYKANGHSLNAVYLEEAKIAHHIGDGDRVNAALEQADLHEPDELSDCHACRMKQLADLLWDSDAPADTITPHLRSALEGSDACSSQPQGALAAAMFAHALTEEPDQARNAHLEGYALTRGRGDLLDYVIEHLQFCVVSGNESRAVDILTEHARLLFGPLNPAVELSLYNVLSLLCRRLIELGHKEYRIPGPYEKSWSALDLLPFADERRYELSHRFDRRNGNAHRTVASDDVANFGRLPIAVPLGFKNVRPTSDSAVKTETSPPEYSEDDLDEAILEAQQRTDQFLPRQTVAWEKVGEISHRLGVELHGSLEAQVAYAKTHTLYEPHETLPELERIFELFTEADLPGRALALQVEILSESFHQSPHQVLEALELVRKRAEELYSDGRIDERDYYSVRATTLRVEAGRIHQLVMSEEEEPARLLALYDRATELDSILETFAHRWAYFRRCDVLDLAAGLTEDHDRRVEILRKAYDLALLSENPGVLNRICMNLSTTYMGLEQPVNAVAIAEKGVEEIGPYIHPGIVITLYNVLAEAHGWLDDEDECQRACLKMAEWGDEHDIPSGGLVARHMMALSLRRQGRHREAIDYFEAVLPEVDEEDVGHLINLNAHLAEIYEEIGQAESGLYHANRALAIMEENPELQVETLWANSLWTAAQLLQSAQRYDEALEMFPRAAQAFERDGAFQLWARASRSVAWLLVEPPGLPIEAMPTASEDEFTKALSTMAYIAERLLEEARDESAAEAYRIQCRVELGHTYRQHAQLLYRSLTKQLGRTPADREEIAPLLELELKARDAYLEDPAFPTQAVEAVENAMILLYSAGSTSEADNLGKQMLSRLSGEHAAAGSAIEEWLTQGFDS